MLFIKNKNGKCLLVDGAPASGTELILFIYFFNKLMNNETFTAAAWGQFDLTEPGEVHGEKKKKKTQERKKKENEMKHKAVVSSGFFWSMYGASLS